MDEPFSLFLAERGRGCARVLVVAAVEGTRPVLVEIQALVCSTAFGAPRRRCHRCGLQPDGFGRRLFWKSVWVFFLPTRTSMLMLWGGLKVVEPAVDLGISLALASSYRNKPVDQDTVALGEVGADR